MNPKHPIFIPSKGRWETRLTMKALDYIGVSYHAVIEPQEYEAYAVMMDTSKIIVLPHQDKGLIVTRNWIWDYAAEMGVSYFWTFDDNIRDFFRLNKNIKARVSDGTILRIVEDFAERYTNLAISGFQYEMFAKRKQKMPPLS